MKCFCLANQNKTTYEWRITCYVQVCIKAPSRKLSSFISNQFDFTDNLSNLQKFSSSIGLNTTQPKKKILVIDNQICIGLTYFSPFADIRFTVLKTMLIQQLYKFAAFVAVYPAFIFTSLDVDSVRSASSAVLKRDVVSSDDQMTRDVQQKDILRRNPMFWNQFLTPHNKGS